MKEVGILVLKTVPVVMTALNATHIILHRCVHCTRTCIYMYVYTMHVLSTLCILCIPEQDATNACTHDKIRAGILQRVCHHSR